MSRRDVNELLVLVDNIERLLRSVSLKREVQQVEEILRYVERISSDGSITALANRVAIEIGGCNFEGPTGTVSVLRALSVLEVLRERLNHAH